MPCSSALVSVPTRESGRLVHVSGVLISSTAVMDQQFSFSVAAIHLLREVEMYQTVYRPSARILASDLEKFSTAQTV